MGSRGRILDRSPPVRPNGRLEPDPHPDWRRPTQHMVGGPPLRYVMKRGGGQRHTARGSPCTTRLTKNPSPIADQRERRSHGKPTPLHSAAAALLHHDIHCPCATPLPSSTSAATSTPSRRHRLLHRHGQQRRSLRFGIRSVDIPYSSNLEVAPK